MVDHFSDLTYVHLTRITIQEEILSGKAAFEIWEAIFGVETNRYHAENERFSEQHFDISNLGFQPDNNILGGSISSSKLHC